MIQPVYLHHEFEAIVARVSAKLTPELQKFDSAITGVHYMYGHPKEVIDTLDQYNSSPKKMFDKYPLVAFFLDTDVDRGKEVGIYGEYSVHMAIIRECADSNQTAKERDINNFIPVLTPIYMELMQEIKNRGGIFQLGLQETVPHRATNRYYWGRSGLYGNTANVFNDWVDAIEIQNMKLKVRTSYCPKPGGINLKKL